MKPRPPFIRGFSLVEVMVAAAVCGVLLTGVMSFYVQNLKGMYASEQRMKIAGQIKKFSNELDIHASRSNQIILYKSAAPADFDGPNPLAANNSDRQSIDVDNPLIPLHPAGDFVVFVYYEIPKPTAQPFYRITKLVGYYLTTATVGGAGPVTRVMIDLSAAPSTNSVESILTANWSVPAATWATSATVTLTQYFPLARGLSVPEAIDEIAVVSPPAPTPRLFYMSDARNIIISGQVFTSSRNTVTNDWKTYTDSFFFNITPRT